MKVAVYNQQGKEAGDMTLPKEIFEVAMNLDLVHQVMISQAGNARQVSAHTKSRAEVRGGGKKPWAQKHTGRARHGSIRSPIWVGGGISGGPRNDKNFTREIPKNMRRAALRMVLSEKAKNNLLVVLDAMDAENQKTKAMAILMAKLPSAKATRLVLYPNGQKKIFMATRNIAKTSSQETRNVNVKDLMDHKYLVVSKDGIKEIEDTLSK